MSKLFSRWWTTEKDTLRWVTRRRVGPSGTQWTPPGSGYCPPAQQMKRLGQTHLWHTLTLSLTSRLWPWSWGNVKHQAKLGHSAHTWIRLPLPTPLQSSVLIGSLRAQCHTPGVMTNFNRLPVCCAALRLSTKCALFLETSELNKDTDKQHCGTQEDEKI